ncbi:MAG: 50S ribosomal protein L4 [Thermoplasmatota archaeon]
MTKVPVYGKDGAKSGDVTLPAAFATEYRPDVIRKTVNAFHANRRQPYGSNKWSGKKHAQASVRSGSGISRVPRLTQGNTAVLSPAVVGGRRAHPPKVEKVWSEKINKKERDLAFRSALAATSDAEKVRARGHKFKDGLTMPVVVADDLEGLAKTKDVWAALEAIGVADDLTRAVEGRHQRPGVGKLRGRRLKTPRSALLVVSDPESGLAKAAKNLVGVEVSTARELNTERVAPGGDPGRLTIFTRAALGELEALL